MEDMTSPAVIKKYADRHRFFAKKNLGQNFLADANIARKITDAACISETDDVLEIGPGFGALTQFMLPKAKSVTAVEIDPFACSVLADAFAGADNLRIVHADILKTDLADLTGRRRGGLIAVSNLPYYITSPILLKLLSEGVRFDRIVVMMQKEAAARISGAPGTKDYSSFTVALDYYAEAEHLFSVPSTVFYPRPNVDSSVGMLVPRTSPKITVRDEATFFKTVRAGFAMRRKTLLNCLSAAFPLSKEKLSALIASAGIDPLTRAERLTIEQFGRLSDAIYAHI